MTRNCSQMCIKKSTVKSGCISHDKSQNNAAETNSRNLYLLPVILQGMADIIGCMHFESLLYAAAFLFHTLCQYLYRT